MIGSMEEGERPPERPQTDEEWAALWAYYDVRPVLETLRASGEPDLHRVDWGRFHHWYGPADDVPGLLAAIAGPDPVVADNALRRLWGSLVHQRCTSGPAALAVPFLLRIAAVPATHRRDTVLALAAFAGHRVNYTRETRSTLFRVGNLPGKYGINAMGERSDWCLQAAREALGFDAAILIGLLDDGDSGVRAEAAFALATALDLPPDAQSALRARLAVESDPAARISLVLAIEQLGADPAEAEQWWRDPQRSDDIRFAAAIAWLCLTDRPVPAELSTMLTELTTPQMEQAMVQVPWAEGSSDGWLEWWLHDLIGNPDPNGD